MSLPALNSEESKMNMPGFTAELSLHEIAQRYGAESHPRGHAGGEGMVVPQWCRYVCDRYGCGYIGCQAPFLP
jgi:hypothetical protein